MHFVVPRAYEAIVPPSLPRRREAVVISGLDLDRIPGWALWARLPLQPLAMLWVWRATHS